MLVLKKKNWFLTISCLFVVFIGYSQPTICLGNDTSVCTGSQINIDATCLGNSAITNTVYTLNNPQSFNLGDDDYTGVVNLGFNFEFFGNIYNQIVISDNGYISFNTANANGYASWGVNNIPSTTASVKNTIMSCWEDLFQPVGGNIYFQTIGTAPNRIAIVYYDGMSKFSAACQQPNICYTGSILLFESSNNIEMHISNKTVCMNWGGGRATQGLNNATGTMAYPVPGRNNSIFNVQNDGKRFTPNGSGGYTLSTIPFVIVNTTYNPGIVWEDTEGNSYPYNNGVLTVTIPSTNSTSIGYFISSSTCGVGAAGLSDTTWITPLSSSVSASKVDDICSAGMGSVSAQPISGTSPYTYEWPGLGNVTTQAVNNVSSGTYTVVMTDANGCISTDNVTVGDTPANYTSSYTPVSCPGGADGTATVAMAPPIGNITYLWNDPAGQTTATATGLVSGTYECSITSDVGCSNTIQVVIDEIPGMQLQLVNQQDVTCNSGNDGIVEVQITQGTSTYSYSWTGSSSTGPIANDLAVGTTTLTVTDSKGCVITQNFTLSQPNPVSIAKISQDSIICIGDSVRLFVTAGGGSSSYTYQWSLNGQVLGNLNDFYVTPINALNNYVVTVGETCGSPSTDDTVVIKYPQPVIIGISPDTLAGCYPVTINLNNTTNTLENVDYTIWKYSDGEVDTTMGLAPISHEFGEGLWDVSMRIVTDRGCQYIQGFPQLIEGYSHPEANFYYTPNPASTLEPKVTAYSQSNGDIISYRWFTDSTAKPAYSTLQNPSFVYPNEVGDHNLLLVVENIHHCVDSLLKIVEVKNDVLIFAPNSFTPDGDKFNNTWKAIISGIDPYQFHLQIFNRWGELVFESFDKNGEWDGSYGGFIVPTGTYIWKIEAKDAYTDQKFTFQGIVNVIR